MGRNLGPLNIKDSYEGLVQISGSNRDTLTDGSGSLISSLNVNATTATSASHAIIADSALTATSASHAVNSDTAISSSYALTASFAENVSTPNLQEVTDVGATTTNAITIDGASTSQLSILKNGVNNQRFITTDSLNAIVFNTSGSQVAKVDFSGTPGEIESTGDLTLDTQGGKVIATDISASGYVSASEFIGPLTGNATTATSASHALNADNAISSSYAVTASYAENITTSPIVDGDGTNSARSSQQSASAAPNTNDLNIGGSNNTIASTNVGNYTIVGGTGNNIVSPSYGNSSIFGSKNGTITRGSDGTAMLGGINNSLTDTNNWSSVILGGSGLTIGAGGKRRFMLGGEDNTMGGGSDSFSGIIGGEDNTLTGHERSVIIGGSNITANASSTVFVPNLNVSGSLTDSDGNIGTAGQALTSNGTDKVQWATVGGGAAEWQAATAASSSVSALNNIPGDIAASSPYSLLYSSGSSITATGGGWNVALGGYGHTLGGNGYGASIIGGLNNTIAQNYAGGIYNSVGSTARGYASVIIGADNSQHTNNNVNYSGIYSGKNHSLLNTSWGAMLGGSGNTLGHFRSVVIGGENLSSTKTDEVVVPDLSIYGETFISSSTLGTGSLIDNLGQQALPGNDSIEHIVSLTQAEYDALTPDVNTLYVISGSTAGGAAFPYTGSAQITGSLGVTGSISQGETNSNLGTNTAILSSGHSLISASVNNVAIIASTGSYQSTTQPSRTAIIASQNSYIDSTSAGNNDDIALIGTLNSRFTGGGARQSVIMATNGAYNNGSRFSFVGGGENHVMSGAYANAIVGGNGNRMLIGTNSTIAGGGGNRVGNTTQTDYGFIGGGSNNFLDGDNAAIIAGTGNNNDQLRAVILGGENNTINGGQGGIVAGGINNTVSHDRSVILGGNALSTTKADEVVVPSLDINGTVVQSVQALTITSNTASLDASTGQMFTLGLQNGVDTHLELSNQVAGQTFSLKITNNATSAGTITFDSQFDFEGGTPFTATAATNAVDILTFTTFDGSNVQCVGSKNFS